MITIAFVPVLLLLLGALASSVRIVDEYERLVVLTLGRYTRTLNPGLRFVVPIIERTLKADARLLVGTIEPQDVLTRDNVSVKVSAVCYWAIQNPKDALLAVEKIHLAVDQLAQITLRATVGTHPLDEILANQSNINSTIRKALSERTTGWGISIDRVEIRSVDLDPSMIRAMAQEAEAERSRRARIIVAEGERQAAEKLADAGRILDTSPAALILRQLATISEVGRENSTLLFPMPAMGLGAGETLALTTALSAVSSQKEPR